MAILEKYLTDQKKKEGEEKEAATTPTSQPAYFPMKLLSAVYERCNGEQFEAVSELDFYASMNLQPCEGRLKIRPREKAVYAISFSLWVKRCPSRTERNGKRIS